MVKSEFQCNRFNFGALQLPNKRDFALGHHINFVDLSKVNNFFKGLNIVVMKNLEINTPKVRLSGNLKSEFGLLVGLSRL